MPLALYIPNGTCPDSCTSADRSNSHDNVGHTVTPHYKAESQVFQCSCGPMLEPHPVSSNQNRSGSDAGRCPNPTAATFPLLLPPFHYLESSLSSHLVTKSFPLASMQSAVGQEAALLVPPPTFPVFTSESQVGETVSNGKAEAHPLACGLADGT